MAEAGFHDIRPAHGYVFQHLVAGPQRISDLAGKLGMTAQGASKLVIELEGAGYVERRQDPDDQRNRFVSLTDHGWAAIQAGRDARAALTERLLGALGAEDGARLLDALQTLARKTGGLRELLARRLRPTR
jgi:DNA-binding MarR family transcriptional regulator